MKKTFSIAACCAMIFSISSNVYSAEGLYVSGNLGYAMAVDSEVTESTGQSYDIEFDDDYAISGAIGYGFGNARVEGEIAYQSNDMDKLSLGLGSFDLEGDASSLALLLNGYYDFKNSSAFTPFIGGGIGAARVEVNDMSLPGFRQEIFGDSDDTVFAYQVGAGVGYAVTEKVSFDVQYRYFATSDPEFEDAKAEYSSHNVYAGIRVTF